MGTLTTLRMKYLYILAFIAVCLSAQKISDKNVKKIKGAAVDLTGCAINTLNSFLNQGTHTKGIKVGQLIDILGNQAMRNPQFRRFLKGFKPAENGTQNSLPTVTTKKYLADNKRAFNQACYTLKNQQAANTCKQAVAATFKKLEDEARKQKIMNKKVNGAFMKMVNHAIAESAGFPKLSL